MPSDYTLRFEDRAAYLFACVEGPHDTLDISLAYWREIAAEVRRRGARRLMVLEELRQPSTLGDAQQVIAALPGLGLAEVRIAFVDPIEDVELLVNEQAEARLLGLTGRVFGGTAAAERWLLSDAP